jgi:Uncharacterized conserved protein, contains double-stranded beta-helix domain
MKTEHLDSMVKGWFVGNFEPSLYKTNDCEVAVKSYKAEDYEEEHYHKIATEITVIVKGRVKMFDREFSEGDIIVVEPGDSTDFSAVTDSINVVVKIPGANNDKYIV